MAKPSTPSIMIPNQAKTPDNDTSNQCKTDIDHIESESPHPDHIEEEQEIISCPPGAIPSSEDHSHSNETMSDNDTPQSAISISTDPTTANDQSNQDSVDNNDIVNTIDCIQQGEDSDNFVSDNDDEGFESDANSNTGDWGDFNETLYDGQDYIELKEPSPPSPKPESKDNNKSSSLTVECRAWVCERCHAINNLMDSMTRSYSCIQCTGKYRPGQVLIESIEQDTPHEHDKKDEQEVWVCNKCQGINLMFSNICITCNSGKESSFTFRTSDEVLPEGLPKDTSSKVRQIGFRSKTVKGIGVAKKANKSPINYSANLNSKLCALFGEPYNNSCFLNLNNQWGGIRGHRINGTIYMKKQDYQVSMEHSEPKWIAINEQNGYIAMLEKSNIKILCPKGATEFIMHSETIHTLSLTKKCRVRFVGDNIYIFDDTSYSLYVYQFKEEQHEIRFMSRVCDSYFRKSKMVDFVVTDELLIVLEHRWLGIFKLYPISYYHAIAYSQTEVRANAMEMCIYDEVEENEEKGRWKASIKNYVYILCENNIISVHPTNPSFEHFHHAKSVNNKTSFCNSKKYGTFWISKKRDVIFQSGRCSKDVINMACSLSSVNRSVNSKNHNIVEFNSIVYDEGYGISGRLLIKCRAVCDDKLIHMFYQIFNEDELMLLKMELNQISQIEKFKRKMRVYTKSFNLIVSVYEMLYGSDLIILK